MAKAYNDFYKAMQSSPNGMADAASLSKKIIEPAGRQLSRSARDTTLVTMKAAAAAREADAKKLAGGKGSTDKGGADTAGVRRNAPVPTAPQTVLDGSKIPRELDFSGPGAAKPASQ